jgi:methylated-DNA-[protein]-cysteine S-methyltransferase
MKTPLGWIAARTRGESLVSLSFSETRTEPLPSWLEGALARYFEGDLAALGELDVAFEGTPLQVEVWRELRKIPAGETRSYSEIAAIVGRPRAVRAVGSANARNPVALVVPCHRVIGKDGKLTGYAYGLERKSWLLQHERSFAGVAAH